jgi:hypothetical protein
MGFFDSIARVFKPVIKSVAKKVVKGLKNPGAVVKSVVKGIKSGVAKVKKGVKRLLGSGGGKASAKASGKETGKQALYEVATKKAPKKVKIQMKSGKAPKTGGFQPKKKPPKGSANNPIGGQT